MPVLKNPIEKCFSKLTRYHYYAFSLIFLSKLPIFWHILSLIFLSPPMDYDCVFSELNSTKNACPCPDPVWDTSVFIETLQTKFSVVCESTWLISFSQSILYVGTLIGSLTFGFLADKFGRLSMFSISCLILAVAGCLVSIMPDVISFIIMRCFEGIGVGGTIVTAYVLCVEYCGVSHRETVTALFHIPINLSHMTLAGMSYLLRDCDEFQLAISLPVFLFVALNWLVMESPKWLMDIHDIDKAVNVMERISNFNNNPYVNIRSDIEAYHADQVTKAHVKVTFWKIFSHKKLSLNLICMSVIYFICGMGYYGVSQYIGKMSGDIHTNVAISGALLLPGTIAAVFLLKKLNRRTFLIATNFLSGTFMLIVVSFPKTWTWCRVVAACVCNCFYFMSFIIVFLYGVELFPTSMRNSVLGFLSFLSRVGQIVAPPINALPEMVSGCIFGIAAILGAIVCYPLPETKNAELPSSLEDTKKISRRSTTQEENVTIQLPQ